MKVKLIYLLILTAIISGCTDFFEPSLKAEKVSLLAPAENLETSSYQQAFWWQKHDNAVFYRLQIVSPSFEKTAALLLDTLVRNDKFVYTLEPGKYEWRVRAENSTSQSNYYIRAFEIFPSSLSAQIVQISSPSNTLYTSTASVRYEWLRLFGSTRYRLQVDTNSFADSTKLALDVMSDNLSFTQILKHEGKYEFRVRAENNSQVSRWSIVRHFVYDLTPPPQVVLTAPANKQRSPKNVKLQWAEADGADKYEVFVLKSDSTTLFDTYPLIISSSATNFNYGETGEQIIWRVRAIDKAGNRGALSSFFSFTIQ